MKTYKALEAREVNVFGTLVPVEEGETVAFDHDPGAGWEEVTDGSNSRKARRTVAPSRDSDGDDEGSL
jgi:hypothetical protein